MSGYLKLRQVYVRCGLARIECDSRVDLPPRDSLGGVWSRKSRVNTSDIKHGLGIAGQ